MSLIAVLRGDTTKLSEAIPPAYTKFIGDQFVSQLTQTGGVIR